MAKEDFWCDRRFLPNRSACKQRHIVLTPNNWIKVEERERITDLIKLQAIKKFTYIFISYNGQIIL